MSAEIQEKGWFLNWNKTQKQINSSIGTTNANTIQEYNKSNDEIEYTPFDYNDAMTQIIGS